MANRFQTPNEQFVDQTGEPYSGGNLYFYLTGSDTPANTYSDAALTQPNTNPVVLDAAGRAGSVFLDSTITYKVILKDASNNLVWTEDPVADPSANIAATFRIFAGNPNGHVAGNAGTIGGTGASVVYDITNRVIYICTTTGSASTAVWSSSSFPITGSEDVHNTNYTVVIGDAGRTQVGNASGAITFTLTAAATLGNAFILPLKNIGAGPLTIDANGGELIDGALTLVLYQWDEAIIYCNGATWRIMSLSRPTAYASPGRLEWTAAIVAPAGWLLCFGQTLAVADYPALYAATVAKATVTVTIASPGVVTWTGHPLRDNDPIKFRTTGALPTGITAGTTYYAIYVDANTFQIAATQGGSAINTSGSQSGVHTGYYAPYGDVDASNFLAPDGRDITLLGKGNMGGTDRALIASQYATVLGQQFGEETHALTSGENGPHTHTFITGIENQPHTHDYGDVGFAAGAGVSAGANFSTPVISKTTGVANQPHTHSGTTNSTGSGTAHNNLQPSLVANLIIKY